MCLRSDVATWQQLVDKLYDSLDTTFTATHCMLEYRCMLTTLLDSQAVKDVVALCHPEERLFSS